MGFTALEKQELKKLIRPTDEIETLHEKEIEKELLDFLKSEKLVRQITDYAIFPVKTYFRSDKVENIVLSKFFDVKFNIVDFLKKISEIVSPPFIIHIDCSLVINHFTDKDAFRYVWAQRNLAFNETKRIEHKQHLTNLIEELDCEKCPVETMLKIYHLHESQACFDKSGYIPVSLLSTVFFMTKI
jgi:hypothetical protein